MIKVLEDNVIVIHRGDSATLNVTLKNSDNTTYSMQTGDVLTLTVKAEPTHESPELLQSESASTAIYLSAEAMDAIPAGQYSYDVQLTKANGDVITVIPELRENGSVKNYKNFIVDAEVTD